MKISEIRWTPLRALNPPLRTISEHGRTHKQNFRLHGWKKPRQLQASMVSRSIFVRFMGKFCHFLWEIDHRNFYSRYQKKKYLFPSKFGSQKKPFRGECSLPIEKKNFTNFNLMLRIRLSWPIQRTHCKKFTLYPGDKNFEKYQLLYSKPQLRCSFGLVFFGSTSCPQRRPTGTNI